VDEIGAIVDQSDSISQASGKNARFVLAIASRVLDAAPVKVHAVRHAPQFVTEAAANR
jgi:hypothetical protein